MNEKTWLDYLTAFGSISTPVLVLFLTGLGWRIRSRLERQAALEDKLREDRIGTYNAILKPFIIILTPDTAWQADPKHKNRDKQLTAMQTLMSLEYREQGFRLSLVGSDSVVKAYNNLLQYFYQHKTDTETQPLTEPREMMALLGQFLLEIRRSMGNEDTKLINWDMLEWFLTDARKFKS